MKVLRVAALCADAHEGDWSERDFSEPCYALVAQGYGVGCVLEYRGTGIDFLIQEAGLTALDSLGLDDAPEGLSVWTGRFRSVRGADGETDEYLEGAFRPVELGDVAQSCAFAALLAAHDAAVRAKCAALVTERAEATMLGTAQATSAAREALRWAAIDILRPPEEKKT